ncbi:MAG: type II toxin-antitoxin system death-on-curing family toxin [Actinobacteria bacterium]|nr:type II toxin-antitoxin system death-on-curing family toxin [Actinomycetota bacterium]
MIRRRLSLDETVTINARVLDSDHQSVARVVKIGLLDSALQAPFAGFGDIDVYPEDWQRLGVLCSRLVLNRPFLDWNKRTGLIAMLTLATLNDLNLDLPVSDETDGIILRLAARDVDEETFCLWVRRYLSG